MTPERTNRQEIFTVEEGPLLLQWPAQLTNESYKYIKAWLDIEIRKIKRCVRDHKDHPPLKTEEIKGR